MRPLELRLRNFRSYGDDPVTFDFRGRRLVGIVGPIGAGKSSILDGIAFSLFGRTPSLSRGTKSLINQRADGCVVTFRFAVDDQVWEVVRALRRKGQSQHNLYRYESDSLDASTVETITLEGDVNAKIVELLGLEFDAFSRSVLLAQGRFAEFLTAAPAQRDTVLKGLFGHERIDTMRQLAKDRVEALDLELVRGEQAAANLARLEVSLGELAQAIDESTTRLTELEKAAPAHNEDLALADGFRRDVLALKERLVVVAEMERPDPEAMVVLGEQLAAATLTRQAVAAELEEVEQTWASVSAELADLAEARTVTAEALVLLEELRNRTRRVDELEKTVLAGRDRLAGFGERINQVDAQRGAAGFDEAPLATAREDLHQAEENYRRRQDENMALALRHGLHDGDPCPVCLNPIDLSTLPKTREAALDEALIQRDRARSRVGDLEAKASEARADLARLEAEAEQIKRQAAEAEATLAQDIAGVEAEQTRSADLALKLKRLLGSGDPVQLVSVRQKAEKVLEANAEKARGARDNVRARHDQAILQEQTLTRKMSETELGLANLAGRLELDTQGLPPAGAARVEAMMKRIEEATAGAGDELAKTEAALAEVDKRIEARLQQLAVEGSLDQAIGRLDARLDQQQTNQAALTEQIEEARSLVAGRDSMVAARDRYAQIVADLSTANFVRYLLDSERIRLAELGSEHFQRLSAGRYRFETDGSFNVIDLTAADAIRRPDSLSGGETFLASLGLALALAELVSRSGGRLDAFFLDEGFGSLDPEHLDLAMEGIEAVAAGSSDRLVILVSHVAELRERLEDLIQLERDSLTGNTRVVRG